MKDFQNDVRLARKGDTEAFSRLYSIVYKDMYHAALYNLRNQHDAYDIVSEAVIDAFSTIGKLKNEEAFKSWIMKILFAKIRKKQKEYYNKNLSDDDEEAIDKITFSEFDFESSELKEALDNLDDESRENSFAVRSGRIHERGNCENIWDKGINNKIEAFKNKK